VSFDIDANGIIHVMARDQDTGKEQQVTITASTNFSKSEIDRLVRDARNHEADDQRRKELAEVRNTADNLAYQTEKALGELDGQLPDGERTKVHDKVESLRQAIKGEDINTIRRLSDELQNVVNALSQQLYARQQTGQATSHGGNGHGGEGEGEVIEGQFHEA
jgi:molecular chaperone DnaK